jgi:hypothetical protein
MVTEELVLDVLCEIADAKKINQRRKRRMGFFYPTSFPFHNGPTVVRCSYEFEKEEQQLKRVIFTYRSQKLPSNLSRDEVEIFLGKVMDNPLKGLFIYGNIISSEIDTTSVEIVVKRVVDLDEESGESLKTIVTDCLWLWQTTVMAFEICNRCEDEISNELPEDRVDDFVKPKFGNLTRTCEGYGQSLDELLISGSKVLRPIEETMLTETLAELEKLIGLKNVKNLINRLVQQKQVAELRHNSGLAPFSFSPHLVFTGNPGTGKTTVARLIGKIYAAMGLLEVGHVVVAGRNDLVGEYIGHTAPKTLKKCQEALGGVLFIDEAYALEVGGRDFGSEVVTTLLTFMEENRGEIVVIVAGYDKEMREFLDSNPGLRGRFDHHLRFDNFSPAELLAIFDQLLIDNQYQITPTARQEVSEILARLPEEEYYCNARDVRSLFSEMVLEHAENLRGLTHLRENQLSLLTSLSIPKKWAKLVSVPLDGLPPIDWDTKDD